MATDITQEFATLELDWYGGKSQSVCLLSGTALWHSTLWADEPLPVSWVLVRDPKGRLETKAFFCTELEQTAQQVVTAFIQCWNIEVTFEEVRAHLGVETQKQWNNLAIERTTPLLLALFSMLCLFANALYPNGKLTLYQIAWYRKTEATFSDVLATVRRAMWGCFDFETCSSGRCLFNSALCT